MHESIVGLRAFMVANRQRLIVGGLLALAFVFVAAVLLGSGGDQPAVKVAAVKPTATPHVVVVAKPKGPSIQATPGGEGGVSAVATAKPTATPTPYEPKVTPTPTPYAPATQQTASATVPIPAASGGGTVTYTPPVNPTRTASRRPIRVVVIVRPRLPVQTPTQKTPEQPQKPSATPTASPAPTPQVVVVAPSATPVPTATPHPEPTVQATPVPVPAVHATATAPLATPALTAPTLTPTPTATPTVTPNADAPPNPTGHPHPHPTATATPTAAPSAQVATGTATPTPTGTPTPTATPGTIQPTPSGPAIKPLGVAPPWPSFAANPQPAGLVGHVTAAAGTGWIQHDTSKPDTVQWVPDPVRPSAADVLRFHVAPGYLWSGDAGRPEVKNRAEMIVWPSSGFPWAPKPGDHLFEGIGYWFDPADAYPPESLGGKYNIILSQTNSSDATQHFYGVTLSADTRKPGMDFGGSVLITPQEWLSLRGQWIHAITEIVYGTPGWWKTDLYVNGVLWRQGTQVTADSYPGPNANRKAGIYRNEYPAPFTVAIDPFAWGTSLDAVLPIIGGFGQ